MLTPVDSARRPLALRGRVRRGGRRGWVVACLVAAACLGLAAPQPASAASAGPAPAGPGQTVRGVLERLAVEAADAASAGAGSPGAGSSAWLRLPDRRIPLDASAVRGIPAGSAIAVRLADGADSDSHPDGDPDGEEGQPRKVASVTVLSRASATARTVTAAAHPVTVVLALPAGAKANGATAAAISRVVTGEVSRFWSQASDGRFSFTVAKAVGWTRLTSSCSSAWSIWDEVRQKSGFVPGARRHLLVYVPPGAGCPTGLATVGASADTGGYAIVGGTLTGLIAHELGHNLGLGHSDALACSAASDAAYKGDGFGTACRRVAYGDWYDVMGISWENVGSLSTAHSYRLGLLGPGSVVTARGSQRVTLRPVSARSGLRSLRVVDPAGATYVVEYRPAAGADVWLGTAADWRGLQPGVLVRRADPGDATQTLLLDPTPSATTTSDTDVTLRAGQVLTTASRRMAITVESVSPDAVTVAVALDGAWPALVIEPRGRLVNGRQVTIGEALAVWGSLAS